MKTQEKNMPENHKPQPPTQVDKEKLAQELYPTPTRGPLNAPHKGGWPTNKTASSKLPWGNIALLGSLTLTPFVVALYLLDKLNSWTVFGLTVLGVIPAGALVVLLVTLGISTSFLRKFGLQRPGWTAALALLLITPVLLILSSIIPREYALMAWIVSGALGFCLATYILEKAKPVWSGTILAAFILIPAALIPVLNVLEKHYDTTGIYTQTLVKSVDWKLLPDPIPAYLTDQTSNIYDTKSCSETKVYFSYYECRYSFTYPGYLSAQSQAEIDKAFASNPASAASLAPDIQVTVMRDHGSLSSYKYHDGKCDVSGLRLASVAPRGRDYSVETTDIRNARLESCGKTTTPAGKTLYYDSSLFNKAEFEPVPYNFYLEQNDNVVLVQVGDNPPRTGTMGAVHYTDPGYQPAIYKFIDSFQ